MKRQWILTGIPALGLILALGLRPGQAAPANGPIYVDCNATGVNNGSSWANAYTDLQDALGVAISGNQIWVAKGVYKPGAAGNRSATFQLASGVEVYGGFAGTETSFSQRDWSAHVTVLSGDIDDNDTTNADGVVTDVNDIAGSNSYHVVTGSGTNSKAVLNGFTVTGGKADGAAWPDNRGGGMDNEAGNPTLTNITFSGNYATYGGGMLNYNGGSPVLFTVAFSGNHADERGGGMCNATNSDPVLTNVSFSGNTAVSSGGGMYNESNSDPVLTNVSFSGNTADDAGGGMYNYQSSPWLTNVIFSGNTVSGGSGGGMGNGQGDPTLTNVTFSGNHAVVFGGGMSNYQSNPTLVNCILWGNTGAGSQIYNSSSAPTISYSLVEGGCPSGSTCDHLLTSDPQFVDADGPDGTVGTLDDNLRLEGDSPAVDAGDNDMLTVSTDLDYHVRRVDMPKADSGNGTAPIVDMGAYEAHVICVDKDAIGGANDGSCWAGAFTNLQTALVSATLNTELWVAEGVYTPTSSSGRDATFDLMNNVALYGGFGGYGISETLRTRRDWSAHVTVLSGDIDGNDTTAADGVVTDPANIVGDNAYHVVVGSGTNASAVLDGFVITGGRADGSGADANGGGMYNNTGGPTLANVTFSGNYASLRGGGMYNHDCSPMLTGAVFIANRSGGYGGGMQNEWHSSPSLTGVTFSGNCADYYGGGMHNDESDPTLTNVIFSSNYAEDGGGMYGYASAPTLTNVTFSSNHADDDGGGIYDYWYGGLTLANCILWGNDDSSGTGQSAQITKASSTVTVTYSLVQGATAYPGTGNLNANPLFVRDPDPGDGDWTTLGDNDYGDLRLRPDSPAIDAGDNSAVLGIVATDLDGEPRFADAPNVPDTGSGSPPIVDMGAYETHTSCVYLPLILKSH